MVLILPSMSTSCVAYWPLTKPSIRDFSEQDEPVSTSGSSHVVFWKSWALRNDICRCRVRVRFSWGQKPRSRSDKWGLEDNKAWYGQEKKLRVNIAVFLCLSPSVCFSLTTETSTPFECESYILIKQCCGSSLITSIWHLESLLEMFQVHQ